MRDSYLGNQKQYESLVTGDSRNKKLFSDAEKSPTLQVGKYRMEECIILKANTPRALRS